MEAAVNTGGRRIDALKRLLAKERADTLARVKELMREQARNGGQPPADEMDVARSLSEVETHAALFDRAQERLERDRRGNRTDSAQEFMEPARDAATKSRWRACR